MIRIAMAALGIALMAGSALADDHATGDAAAGEKVFKRCKSCHGIVDDTGKALVRGGKTGPNLYGLYTRVAGSEEEFGRKYGKSLIAAGEKGLVWNEADFVGFVADPRGFLKTYNDDSRAKSKMSFKLKGEEEARDVWAYILSVGPEPATN